MGSHMTYKVFINLFRNRLTANALAVIVSELCIKTSNVG
jgi:hypothetical protein